MMISSRDNPNIKQLVKLLTSKKERGESGLFVAEGMRICADAIAEASAKKIEISEIFYTNQVAEKLAQHHSFDCFESINDETKIEISPELADKISDTGATQGVFVVIKKLDKSLSVDKIKGDGKYIILNNIQDPGNVGTIIRTADAVGVDGIILTNNCCDVYNPKCVRSTMGSLFRRNIFIENDFEKVVKLMSECSVKTMAAVVSDEAEDITAVDFSCGCAVVIGNEGNGLSDVHVMLCDKRVTIKMKGNINSLNAASAGTILLWEMFRND